ncbi:MAG TPA: zinc dependent phospholipase C family protein [archaeon]|jgi:hypothetical protein|nr:zinc dependent phospholipase C family protein [archaeon]
MPTVLTHLGFVEILEKKRPAFFKKLDLRYLVSGSLFPDYYGFYKIQTKLNPEFFYEIRNKKGTTFGKRMYAIARTKAEKSFAIGFISHNVLDKHFHNYFNKNGITADNPEDHLMLEFYYDCKFKNIRVSPVLYPDGIIEETLNRYYKNIKSKKAYVTKIKLMGYYLFLKEIQKRIIHKKYMKKEKSYLDLLAVLFYKKPINLKKLLNPNKDLKNKHIKNLEKVFAAAEKEMLKIISSINH